MSSTKLQNLEAPDRTEWTIRTGVPFINSLLDLVLKISVLLLALPALAILTYLKTIHRTDLFMPAVASAPGLFALLEATFILCVVILTSFVGPSWIASQIAHTYGKAGRPTLGSAGFVLTSGVASGLFFLSLGHMLNAAWPAWLKWIVGITLAFLILSLLFLLAWHSPPRLCTLADSERADPKKRIWQSVKRTLLVCLSGLITVSTVVTFGSLFPLYGISGDSWGAWLLGALFFPASLLPAAMYLARLSWGDSRVKAVTASAVMLAMTVVVSLLWGVSPEPLALLTMRAMSIAEKEPRTFELVAKTEQSALQALGFQFIGESSFFRATIRFQFGDVRLICVAPYDAAGHAPVPKVGCVTLVKDEVRVVEAPAAGLLASLDVEAPRTLGPVHDGPAAAPLIPSTNSRQ